MGVNSIADDDPHAIPKPGINWAWGLCWLLFASTMLNYMDRQAIAVVRERITEEFHIGHEDFGWVVAAFLLPYALFLVPAGYLADRWDVRKTYAAAVIWWSLAAIAVAWSPTFGALMAFRAVLGMGESFNWPCALRITAIVLPPADRGLGNGIFNSGAAIGAVLTPLIVVPLTLWFGWRVAFAIIGAIGLIWVVAWVVVVNGPARSLFDAPPLLRIKGAPVPISTRLAFAALLVTSVLGGLIGARWQVKRTVAFSDREGSAFVKVDPTWKILHGSAVHKGDKLAEPWPEMTSPLFLAPVDGEVVAISGPAESPAVTLRYHPLGLSAYWLAIATLMIGTILLARLLPLDQLGGDGWAAALGEIVRLRRFWVLLVGSISINVCWHFLVNFLPTYLKDDRGMPFVAGSLLSSLPFLAADAGNLGGGAASRWLARRGSTVARSRSLVLSVCVFLIASGAGVGWVRDNGVVVALLALMALGTAGFMANSFAYCQDVLPGRTGLVVGIVGGIGNLFAAGFAPLAGRIKDTTGGYGLVFLIVGLLPFIGLGALLVGWGRDPEPIGKETPILHR